MERHSSNQAISQLVEGKSPSSVIANEICEKKNNIFNIFVAKDGRVLVACFPYWKEIESSLLLVSSFSAVSGLFRECITSGTVAIKVKEYQLRLQWIISERINRKASFYRPFSKSRPWSGRPFWHFHVYLSFLLNIVVVPF